MASELSLVSLVLFFSAGLLMLLLLVIFAKRKFGRVTFKPSKRKHGTIGQGVPKELSDEIMRRLQRTNDIKLEAQLIHDRCEATPNSLKDSGLTCNYKYRMLAMDAFSSIDKTLSKLFAGHQPRHANMSVRTYLLTLHHKGPLLGASQHLINAYADAYDHARHSPQEFGQDEYKAYIELLQQVISCIQSSEYVCEREGSGKVDTAVFINDGCRSSPVQVKAIKLTEMQKTSPGMLQGMQTRLRTSAKPSDVGDEQALLESISSARSSEGHSNHGSSEKLIVTAESTC